MNRERYEELRDKLKIKCSSCIGLCCIGLYYMKSDGFPADKPAGIPCCHLQKNHQCKIHQQLASKNLRGCMNYDCIGAGQRTVELCELQEGWIDHKKKQDFVIEVYHKVFELHQMLWYLLQAYDMAEEELKEQIAKNCREDRCPSRSVSRTVKRNGAFRT